MEVDFTKNVYLKKSYHVNGPIWCDPNGKPINEDKFLRTEIRDMDIKKFNEYFCFTRKEALEYYISHLEGKVQSYIQIHLKHGYTPLIEIEKQARTRYKKKITRAMNQLLKLKNR